MAPTPKTLNEYCYRMVPLSMNLSDLWPGFQGRDIFRSWISENRRVLKTFWDLWASCHQSGV